MLRKKWIAREDLSDVRDASRTIQIATLQAGQGKLNANQQTIVAYLRVRTASERARGGTAELAVPRTTLQTLVRRGDGRAQRRSCELSMFPE